MKSYFTCTACGETWATTMKTPPRPCTPSNRTYGTLNTVRPATQDEIDAYERMFGA